MAEEHSQDEKTGQPTPRRREDSRKKGQVARSQELNSVFIILTGMLALVVFYNHILAGFTNSFYFNLDKIGTDITVTNSYDLFIQSGSILGCPCGIVYSPEELSLAIRSQTEGLIFIDTTGVNPENDKEIGELHSFIRAAKPHEIHLVAAASTPARDIRRLIDVFGESGIDKILITKLDETEAAGGVITAAIESGKQLPYISCSREIPGRFGLASPESLAETLTSEKPHEPAQSGWEMEAVGIWQ